MDNNYCGKYEVECPGGTGELTVSRDGAYYLFECSCPPGGGVQHLYCLGGDHYISIGVPVPSGSQLYLRRQVSAATLQPLGGGITKCLLAARDYTPESSSAETAETAQNPDVPSEMCEAAALSENQNTQPAGTAAEGEASEESQVSTVSEEEVSPDETSAPASLSSAPVAVPAGWSNVNAGQFPSLPSDSGAIYRIQHGETLVAIPYCPGGEFAVPALLRWGMPTDIEGQRYLVYKAFNGELKII